MFKPPSSFTFRQIMPIAPVVPQVMMNKTLGKQSLDGSSHLYGGNGGKNNSSTGIGPTQRSQNPSQTRWGGGNSIAPSQQTGGGSRPSGSTRGTIY